MTSVTAADISIDWGEVLRGPQDAPVRMSSGAESYTSTSISESLSGSLSGSVTELSAAGATAYVSSAGAASAGKAPAPALHFEAQLPARRMTAPVPSRSRDSHSVAHLLRASSSHFDALEVGLPHLSAKGATGHSYAMLPGDPTSSPERSLPSPAGNGGPRPDVLLAALSASLAARQHQQQQGQHQQQQGQQQQQQGQAGAGSNLQAAPAPRPAHACHSCSSAFSSAQAYHAHCASLEHAVAVVNGSLAVKPPGMGVQSAGTGPAVRLPAALHPESSALSTPHHRHHQSYMPARPSTAGQAHGRQASSALTCDPSALLAVLGGQAGPPPALPQPTAAFMQPSARPALPLGMPSTLFCLTSCCNQVIDPQLDVVAHALLKQLRQLDGVERAVGVHVPRGAGKLPRRLVGGLREVRKAVKTGTAAALVAAVDIQETNPCHSVRCAAQPGAEIAEICQLAAICGVPVVFALTRIGLGSIFGANKRMSAVALTNVSGLEGPLQHMLSLAAMGRARYAAMLNQSHMGPHMG